MKKLFALKIAALFLLLPGLQIVFAAASGYKDIPATVRALDDVISLPADVLYLGDSTLYRGDDQEADRRTLPQMLDEALPGLRVVGVYHDAYHLALLEQFCRVAINSDTPPKVIVVPINMRSFADERASRPEYQFVKESLFLSYNSPVFAAFFRPLATFHAFNLEPISEEEYLDIETFDGDTRLGTFRELRALPIEEQLPLHVRACYRYQLDSTHSHIRALDRIAAMCQEARVHLIVYATPTDYERGEELIGAGFSEGIERNLNVVSETLQAHDIQLIDLAFTLPKITFAHDGYPDAYLTATGKEAVAQRLAAAIQNSI